MKRVTAILLAMALIVLMALPAFAQGTGGLIQIDLDEQNNSGISGTATLEDQGDGTTRVDLVLEGVEEKGAYPAHIHAGQCPEPGEITYPLESVVFNANAGAGVSVTILEASIDEILAVQSAINVHLYSDPSVYVACGNLPMAGGDKQVPDNQQDGEDKDAGAGDDQQDDGTGAGDDEQGGKTPDNQQGGGKEMVTKTFELTLNGTVPEDRAFGVAYGTFDDFDADEDTIVIFCGQPDPQIGDVVVSDEDCVGDGETYTYSAELPVGMELYFTYLTAVEGDEENTAEPFFGNITFEGPGEPEVLDTDFTNTAWYTFSGGASDKQETPDNQQDDVQDDQQGEMPEEMPETGAGALAPGAAIPVGNAAVGLTMLVGVGYAVLRCR